MLRRAYLSTPYSHHDPAVRRARVAMAGRVAMRLMLTGWGGERFAVFSPIVHGALLEGKRAHGSAPLQENADRLAGSWNFWMEQDLAWLASAEVLFVYPDDAGVISRGVRQEIRFAQELGIEIIRLPAEEFGLERLAAVEAVARLTGEACAGLTVAEKVMLATGLIAENGEQICGM